MSTTHEKTTTAAYLKLLLFAAAALTTMTGGVAAQSIASQQQSGSGWDDDQPWSLRNLFSRFTGFPAVASLCAVSNCQRSQPLPARPGGPYAEFGPLQTRLVYLSASTTRDYGFPGAVVACPVVPPAAAAAAAEGYDGLQLSGAEASLLGNFLGFSQQNTAAAAAAAAEKKKKRRFPGVAWSYGGNGNCDGTGGFADAADGYPGLYGEVQGYWLPELLEHMASHGIVTICPYLSGGGCLLIFSITTRSSLRRAYLTTYAASLFLHL